MTDTTRRSHPVLDPYEGLIRLHLGLPRKGPGLEACTLRALAACQPLPPTPEVLDLGCGSGASTLPLARALGKPLTAVDACAPFLAELEQEAGARGLTSLVKPLCLDFSELDFRPASFDLLWSEGAIYTLGWKPGLCAWAPLVRSGGFLALTEAVWLTEDPPPPAVAYWASSYPTMTTMARSAEQAASLGLELVESFPLPGQAWRDYYAPLARRCAEWAPSADPALGQAIAETQAEMALHERYGHCYGYAFFVLRVP